MTTSKGQQVALAQYQQQEVELSAEIVRLRQENDRLIRDSVARSESVELEEDNQIHQSRDRLLEAASAATNILLTLDNLDEAIDTALRIVGEGSGCDRIGVLENFCVPPAIIPTYHTVIYEWTRLGIVSQLSHAESGCICTAGIEPFLERYYVNGDGFGGLLAEWEEPLRSAFAAVGVESSYAVPIRVKEQWWGVLGFDYCQSPVRINPAEIAVLKTIAACIGSAIQRDRTQKATLQAEHARSQELQVVNAELQQTLNWLEARERILEATATVANDLLTTKNLDESIDKALQIIGEILDADRVGVIEIKRFDSSSDLSSVYWKAIYEWHSVATASQTSDAEYAIGTFEGIEEWLELFANGQCISYLLEEMPEPFRSGQAALGVKALHFVPIFIDDRHWGNFCIDDCREANRRSSGELAVLKTIAACIGSAIKRDRTQKATLQAQQARSQELQALNTKLQQTLDRLETRDRLLEATAATANVLLTIPQAGGCANDNFDAVVDKALQILGESLETDRIKILENSFDDSMSRYPGSSKVLYEWTRDGTIPQISHIAGEIVTRGLEDFMESFLLADGFGGLVDEWIEPFRSSFKLLDVKSTACVPIRIENQFWGILAFDDCRAAKYRSQAEIAVLKTVANCIGSAIQRDRTTTAILQAEQARAAELKKANEVLKKSLDYLATETSLEKFLGQILGAIAEQFDSPLAEYWYHPGDTAYIGMMSWHGQTYDRAEMLQQYPDRLGVDGFPIPPEMMSIGDLPPHKQYFITEDWLTDPNFKQIEWLPPDNLYKQINVPLVLGNKCIGALVVRMPSGHQIATEQIELAQALAHQVILVVQFTRLAEEAKQAAIYEERNRLAGEIHDTLAQTFTGISVQLELVKYLNPQHSNEVRSILDRISSLAQTGLGEARRSVWSIYSATEDFADLAQQLADCVENLTAGTDLHTQIDLVGTSFPLSSFLGVNLLRIGQESIVNTLKHAQATTLTIELEYSPHQVSLCIRDNGRGFAPQVQTEGFGLISISERADRIGGQLRITTQLGQGTEIFVQVPL